MYKTLLSLSTATALIGGTAMADVPAVAVDIAPVHSLVARVMAGVGTPNLILPPGASPHEYNLRPSEATALQAADIVVWMGGNLAPWMEGAVETLAADARVMTLLEAEETMLLNFREGALFEAHKHGSPDHGGHDHKDHAQDHDPEEHAHDDHGHEEHTHEDDHGNDHKDDHAHDHHGHAHGTHDPHAWLSPANAAIWLNLIAGELSAADPANASAYFANATMARAELEALSVEVNGILDPVRGGSFIVFHDAYQYFEADFDFPASGAIALGDATEPGPARIAEIQGRVRGEGVDCVLAEPQYNPDLVATILDGTDANTGVIDPLGVDLAPGPALYPQLIRNMAATLAGCL
ncbi:MAG: zinc ABC transporter substrate-binding protein [Rhodobacteraceae bacterium]|nr:zinc ABC transporter substrate-binding protein [Paracoccaceae bacterium]